MKTAPVTYLFKEKLHLLLLFLILLLTSFLYLPGLDGPFLFDDWANLPVLGYFGPVDNWPVFLRYITAGVADPTGRPVAQLSFLLDANNWPTDPWPLKRTNLVLHLLNGVFLYMLLLRLNRLVGLQQHRSTTVALLATALWLLHPLWISTVLYIVQRQAILVATWTLLTLLGYLHGRQTLSQSPLRGFLWMSFSLFLGTLLATLSKANGALLPLWAGVMEATLLQRYLPWPDVPPWKKIRVFWRLIFLWLPSLLVLGWLLLQLPQSIATAQAIRPFSIGQRLLSEFRILLDYLGLLLFPRPYTTGLFNDAYPVSMDFFHPWTTLPAIGIVFGLIYFSWKRRKNYPLFSVAILFFFSAHILESTILPLELYFEHRNYVAALFLFWPLSAMLIQSIHLNKTSKILIGSTMIVIMAILSWMRADLWGNGEHQAYLWAMMNPDSARAQTHAALYDIQRNRHELAVQRLQAIRKIHPFSVQATLNLISAKCALNRLTTEDLKMAEAALAESRRGRRILFNWIPSVIGAYGKTKACSGLDASSLKKLLDAAEKNRQFQTPGGQQDIFFLRGLVDLEYGHPDKARDWFKKSIITDPQPEIILELAAKFARRGYHQQGLQLLQFGRKIWQEDEPEGINMQYIHRYVLHSQKYWEHEFAYLEKNLQRETEDTKTHSSGDP